jgi:hypothetical protein
MKAPAFQFYPSDWQRDMDDYPLEIEGAWIRICCRLYWSEGKSTKTLEEWSRILREKPRKTEQIFKFFSDKNICDLDNQNGTITITSRRMVRDAYIRKVRKESGILGGNPQLKTSKNENVLLNQTDNQTVKQKPTPSSSSSSSIKNNKKNIIGIPPKIEDIKIYCSERGNGINPEQFFDYYESRGWMIGKNKMKNWQAAIRTWEKNNKDNPVKPADTEDYIGKALRGEI